MLALNFSSANNEDLVEYLLIRLSKQTLQAQQNSLDIVHSTPLVFEDVEAYSPAKVNVRMVNGRLEEDCRWCVWVVRWERERELQVQAGIRSFCGTNNGGCPVHQVAIGVWEGRDARCR